MHDLSRHELSGVVIVCRDLEEALEMGFNARLSRHELSSVGSSAEIWRRL